MPAPQPRMHGIGHRRGGPDPIDDFVAFNTYPQSDNWLWVETLDTAGAWGTSFLSAKGTRIEDYGDVGMQINTSGTSGLGINSAAGISMQDISDNGITIGAVGTAGFAVLSEGGGPIALQVSDASNSGMQLDVYGASNSGISIRAHDTGTSGIFVSSESDITLLTTPGAATGTITLQSGVGGIDIRSIDGGTTLIGGHHVIIDGTSAPGSPTDVSVQIRIRANAAFFVTNAAASVFLFEVYENGQVHMPHLPTSPSGLPAGALWNSSGTVHIV